MLSRVPWTGKRLERAPRPVLFSFVAVLWNGQQLLFDHRGQALACLRGDLFPPGNRRAGEGQILSLLHTATLAGDAHNPQPRRMGEPLLLQ